MDNKEILTKRDHLAGIALQGLIIANAGKQVSSYELAKMAANHADHLIAALGK